MFRVDQRVAVCDIKVIVVDIVQKHIDAAEIIDGEVDSLPKEPLPYIFFSEALEIILAVRPFGRTFNVAEHRGQVFVEVGIMARPGADIDGAIRGTIRGTQYLIP